MDPKFERALRGWLAEEAGQALAEYGLIIAFVALACVVALGFLGFAIGDGLDAVTAGFP